MKDEVPHLKRAPSEYLREHIWVSTQPMEEAEEPEHLIDAMHWIGWDRILFASDYPPWISTIRSWPRPRSRPRSAAARSTAATPRALWDWLMTRWSIFPEK